jgi:hypothetical protein
MVSQFSTRNILIHALILSAFVVGSSSASDDTSVACGKPGHAFFNTNGKPQDIDGELYSAVHCYVDQIDCDSPNLADGARQNNTKDPTKVKAYYGNNIGQWCVDKVTDFTQVFNGTVSVLTYCVCVCVPCVWSLFLLVAVHSSGFWI